MPKNPTTTKRNKPQVKSSTKSTKQSSPKVANQYDNGDYNYLKYWDNRDYEHASEEMALKRLLGGKHFKSAADVGGGYGRLCVFLQNYADQVTLAEPSKQQHAIAKDFLKDYPKINRVITQADDLKLADKSQELLTVIRVMHHLPDPATEFKELHRVLSNNGYLVLEVANYAHGRNRLKHIVRGQKLPTEPVDIRSKANRNSDEPAFVNHNPKTVIKQLAHAGFIVEKTLSVSNLRSPKLKKILPKKAMLAAESIMQPALAKAYFGPSVFFLVRKAK